MQAGRESLQASIEAAVLGHRLGDVSHAMQSVVEKAGFNVVREYGGHGIGRAMHEEPHVANFGTPKNGHSSGGRHGAGAGSHGQCRYG